MKKVTLLTTIFLQSCTSVTVEPVDSDVMIKHICIQENPKVIVEDFLPVLLKRLEYHGISSQIYRAETTIPDNCEYAMTYSARQSWDFVTYLSQANLWLAKDGQTVAMAEYHLVGKGGLSLFKWQEVESKMNPVIDELLGKAKKSE